MRVTETSLRSRFSPSSMVITPDSHANDHEFKSRWNLKRYLCVSVSVSLCVCLRLSVSVCLSVCLSDSSFVVVVVAGWWVGFLLLVVVKGVLGWFAVAVVVVAGWWVGLLLLLLLFLFCC